MNANPIADRISSFLKEFTPFSFFEPEVLQSITKASKVRHAQAEEIIFEEESKPQNCFFVVYKGSVKVELRKENRLIDWAEAGDCFGVRAMLSGQPYLLTATCAEESLLLEIPIALFKACMEKNAQVLGFYAAGLASGTLLMRNQMAEVANASQDSFSALEINQKAPISAKGVFYIASTATLQEAAKVMVEKNIGSLIISDNGTQADGIITDKDLRKALAFHERPALKKVAEIMSRPVLTIPPDLMWFEVYLKMMKFKIRHLVITDNGKIDGKMIGLISEHDLVQARSDSPIGIIKRMQTSEKMADLATLRDKVDKMIEEYLAQEVGVPQLSHLITTFNDELVQRIIVLAEAELKTEGYTSPKVSFCWLSLGSEARKEQFARTDQDNALVFEDSEDDEIHKKYFLALARKVNEYLEKCGFERCPAFVMASNPDYCLPFRLWKQQFAQWISVPEPKAVMNATIFFDFRAIYGNTNLANELQDYLHEEIRSKKRFLTYLGFNALQNPPALGFFKGLNVETEGAHKDQFDLKARALMPLADSARLLVLSEGIKNLQSTLERYEALSQNDSTNAALYKDAAKAYEILLKFRAKSAFLNKNSGRFLTKAQMSHLDRSILKKAFQPIAEIQKLIEVRFQTNYLG